ncbi:carbohydrate ABC transporter permease [Streptomyces chiangmaiensis]
MTISLDKELASGRRGPDRLAPPGAKARRLPSRLRGVDWVAYAYVLPSGVLLGVFGLWPVAFGFWISLWQWGIVPERFVGLGNYAHIFGSDLVDHDASGHLQAGPVGQALLNTIYYTVATVGASVALAFVIAYLLFRVRALRNLLRTLFFLPYATTITASGLVFVWIFDPQLGVANAVLRALGLPAQTWLLDPTPIGRKLLAPIGLSPGLPDALLGPSVALCVVIVFSVWNTLGFSVMIYLSGLSALPRELMDAADIDGAAGWRKVRHVVLPLVSPTTLFLLVYTTAMSFKAFTPIYALTQGASGAATGCNGPADRWAPPTY